MGDRAMPSTQTIFPALTKDDFLAQERERIPTRVTMTVMSANVLRWLGGLSTIPNEVLEAGRVVLCRAQQDGAIRDYRLYALGSDLVMQIMTLGQGLHNPKVCALASDERGSHYMMLLPKPLTESVATVRSRGLQIGLMVTLNSRGITETHDVFAEPSYREARLRIDRINAHFWRSQGSEFTPIGVGARDVEPAYPLMKVLNRITGKDSPYAQTIQSVTQELYNGVE